MQTLRFADEQTVQDYPLDIPGSIEWTATTDGWRSVIDLPDVPAHSIITPSLSLLNDPSYGFRFTLETGDDKYPLVGVPPDPGTETAVNGRGKRVRTAIDCFHTLKKIRNAQLVTTCMSSRAPQRYLLTLSMRPTECSIDQQDPLPCISTTLPPSHSQMLENPRIARGICSPVSTAMVLAAHRQCVDYQKVIAACRDPITGMYGMWPLAIRCASRHECIGAVELFSDWSPVIDCLNRGIPVVASIRYGKDELPGSPQRSTGGHLVVVHGISGGGCAAEQVVLVNDPAAPNHGSVHRRYPLQAFSRAWFRYRGAAYILSP